MTLLAFNNLNENSMINLVLKDGVFLQHHISKTEIVSCYAIDLFFVECVYAVDKNKITVFEGKGSFVDATHVAVEKADGTKETIEAKNVIKSIS